MGFSTLLLFAVLAYGGCGVSSVNEGQFWHVTDFHYDHTYLSSQLSCNNKVPSPAGDLGDYWCDSPWRLVTAAIEAMKNYKPDVDFLLWTGDTVAHIKDANLSVDINMDILQNITVALTNAFPNKTVYATFGNHDYWPSDQFPNVTNDIYNRTAQMWSHWIEEPEQLDNFRKGGYYSRKTAQGLRILALNTNLYYTSNKETKGNKDPSDQLQWMRAVLQKAKTDNEKVLVTAHIPPGVHTPSRVSWFYDEFVQPVNSALKDFAGVIVGMHFGHDHHDGFKIFQDNTGQPAVPLLVAPSVTPWRYKLSSGAVGPPHDPSVRLVTYDRDTGKHLDLEQLRLDLSRSSQPGGDTFSQLYKFTQKYNVPDLSAVSLEKLVNRMATGSEGDNLLDVYFRLSVAGANQTGINTCDKTCKYRFLCGFRHYTLQGFDNCVASYNGASSFVQHSSATAGIIAMLMAMVVT